jgi:hypothetical protein
LCFFERPPNSPQSLGAFTFGRTSVN